jgi:hypothetical protein
VIGILSRLAHWILPGNFDGNHINLNLDLASLFGLSSLRVSVLEIDPKLLLIPWFPREFET